MTYSIELFFDPKSAAWLGALWTGLQEIYGRPMRSELGVEPHLALAVFRAGEPEGGEAVVEAFAQLLEPFELELTEVGTFPSAEGVVYLRPAPSLALSRAHAELHRLLDDRRALCLPYYQPGQWIPHVTVATDVPAQHVPEVVDACTQAGVWGRVGVERVGSVRYRPARFGSCHRLGSREP